MGANYQISYMMNAHVNTLRAIITDPRFSSELRVSLKSENPTPYGVWYRFHHGTSFTSWGEKITITLTYMNEVTTNLTILSECGMPTQVIDWGKNKQNVCNIFEYIQRALMSMFVYQPPMNTQPCPAPQAAAQSAPANTPPKESVEAQKDTASEAPVQKPFANPAEAPMQSPLTQPTPPPVQNNFANTRQAPQAQEPVKPIVCIGCGFTNPPGSFFCNKCGNRIR